VLGLGQFEPSAKRHHRGRKRCGAGAIEGESGGGPFHQIAVYPRRFTMP